MDSTLRALCPGAVRITTVGENFSVIRDVTIEGAMWVPSFLQSDRPSVCLPDRILNQDTIATRLGVVGSEAFVQGHDASTCF